MKINKISQNICGSFLDSVSIFIYFAFEMGSGDATGV